MKTTVVRSHERRLPEKKSDPLIGTIKPLRAWKPRKEWPRARPMSRSAIIEMMRGILALAKRDKRMR